VTLPLPQPRPARTLRNEADHRFWRSCEERELCLPQCDSCGKFEWPPTPECGACGGGTFSWKRLSGLGCVRSFCTFERAYYRECPTPWTVLLVELDEGPLFIGNPKGIADEELREGLRVRLAWLRCRDVHGEFNLPVFEREESMVRAHV